MHMIYEFTIEPQSAFGTPLRGDILFGHLCSLLQARGFPLEEQLRDYISAPFCVIADPLFSQKEKLLLPAPHLPPGYFLSFDAKHRIEALKKRKEFKKKSYVLFQKNGGPVELSNARFLENEMAFQELFGKDLGHLLHQRATQVHNTINRLTQSTGGDDAFAPHQRQAIFYPPKVQLSVLVYIRNPSLLPQIQETLHLIGQLGYGGDASTGLGRFAVKGPKPATWLLEMLKKTTQFNAVLSLSPVVWDKTGIEKAFYKTFTHFGRHGAFIQSPQIFKNPIIFAETASAFLFSEERLQSFQHSPYFGAAVENVSHSVPNAVAQGYSIPFPVQIQTET